MSICFQYGHGLVHEHGVWFGDPDCLRYFRNPCGRDPPTRNFKKLNSSKIPLKYLTFTFGERTFTFGGTNVHFWGYSGFSTFFGISFFVAGGFWDSVGRGASRGFRKYLTIAWAEFRDSP